MHGNPGIKKPVFIMKLAGPWTLVLERERHQKRQVVDAGGDLGKHAADPPPALAILPERERALHQVARRARGRLDMASRVKRLAVAAVQLGLVVERVHLADAAVHEELDHPAHLGAMMQPAVQIGTRPRPAPASARCPQAGPRRPSMRRQGDAAQAAAQPPENIAPGDLIGHGVIHRSIQLTYKNSLLLTMNRHRFASPWRAA